MWPSYFLVVAFLCLFEHVSTRYDSDYFEEDCAEPPDPNFGRIWCTEWADYLIECEAVCKQGYELEDGTDRKKYSCNVFEGGWNGNPPPKACSKKCDPRCENNGTCSSEDRCICTPEYRGSTCQYHISLCDPAKLGFDNYIANCDHPEDKSTCVLDCPDGTQFESAPADIYECSLEGVWTPSSAPICEPLNLIYGSVSVAMTEALSTKSTGICAAWGNFHYRTFDGSMYSFHAPCTYLLAKDCKEGTFSIHINHNSECTQDITCAKNLTIYIGDESYHIEEQGGAIKVKQGENELNVPGTTGGLQLERVAHYLIVTSTLGFRLKWDGKQTVLLYVSDKMKNKTCGLCGQYDGSVLNDLEMLDGNLAKEVNTFADSWKMPKLEEICTDTGLNNYGCTYKTEEEKITSEAAHKACFTIYNEDYADCHQILDPKPYFAACKIEFCGCKEPGRGCICDTLAEYFRECVRLGGKIHGGWRKEDLCSLNCPTGMEYVDCGSSCPKTCRQAEYECDYEHCVDGCHCQGGFVLHKGECIPKDQCPCTHADQEFSQGEKIPNDCNECECVGGKWECTEKLCSSRCTSTGAPHYKTFDGHIYQFHGKCSYYLVYHNNFTVVQDNSLCIDNGFNTLSNLCKKTILVDAYSTRVELKHDLEVTVNGQDIKKFPFTNKHIKLQKTSSAILLDITNGVSLTWEGVNNVYVDAPAQLKDAVQGLCGTFNRNSKDDFLTPDGAVEALVDDFAEKWKTDAECREHIANIEIDHPCETYKEKEEDAHKLCSVLKSDVFQGCHHEEDPESFYKDCLYDICTCKRDIKHCLCPSLANYAAACVKKDTPTFWRNQVKECEIECSGGQTYQECSNPCAYSCKSLSVEKCDKKCVEGCACSQGTALSSDGVCIPISECPCYSEGKEYPPKSTRHISALLSCDCNSGQWNCKTSTTDERHEMMAEQAHACDNEKHLVYSDCVQSCQPTCQNYYIHPTCDSSSCVPGCSCKDGYVLDTEASICLRIEECGCLHGGKRFPEGGSYRRDCNKCTCIKGKWACEEKVCPGICSVWGESHCKTFDRHSYDFQGNCEYILARGEYIEGKIFQITMETKLCGTNGVTCPKGVKLQFGNEEKLVLSHDEELPKPSYDSPFIVRKVGLSVFVYTRIGIIVQWDRASHISIHANPEWKGKLSGLCGNFNDDLSDDFKTPSSGPIEARPLYFVDSWKLNDACPFPQHVTDICLLHPDRKPWAQKRCAVLKSDIFQPCHKFVAVDLYYENCVSDTCACDLGGDCECFCTAISAYAEECLIHGIAIAWRSQELCAIQCQENEKYEPCMSTCPRETCETTFLYDDVKKVCNNQPCVEGCKPKVCPHGLIFNNDRDFKCILEIDCEVPCKEINGKVYTEGEQIKDYSVVNICQTCHCTRGNIVCTGKPCPIELHCDSTGWSEWMNSPSNPSGDYERLDDPRLQKIYYKMCSLEYISEIECRTTFSRLPVEYSGQKAVCELPVGLICDNAEQHDGQCVDFEIRVLCNCGATTMPATSPGIPGAECLVPGWTQWMPTNVLTYRGEGEIVSELRKYYAFCPDEEIEEVDCRITTSKKHQDSGRNYKCTKNGLQCPAGVKGKKCPDYDIRFYCRCEETECAYPRGVETNVIRNSQITASSILSFGETDGYYARLNGEKAWTPKSNSKNEWIQVDVGEIQQLTGIVTQGNPNALEWVEKYKVYYSVDNVAYEDIYDSNRQGVIFEGNSDQNTPAKNYFPSPLRARYIRIYPYEWYGAVSLRLELLGCNVHVVTEMPMETPLPCVPGWTEYFNTDSPNEGDGDEEKVENIINNYGVCFGGEISDIECKALIDGEEVSHTSTGDFGVTCKKSVGSFCSNFLQTGKRCEDYMIRLYCTCEVPTIPPTCEWSEWINIDKPRSFKTDAGDIESIEKLQQYYGVCQKPYLKDIECRIAQTQEDWKLSPQNELKCNIDVGFACYNRLQPADCFDYEVRFYCFYDWCLETTTVSITPSVPITTTSPCPPGQYYDECAYTCNKTCSDYLYKLHQIGKCQTGDQCIATCRPYESCEYPFLWKDPYTCVEISKCGCVMPNGDIIEHGEVVHMDCEQCQCFDSIVSCQIAPECTSSPPPGKLTQITESSTITTQSPEVTFVTTPQGLCPEEMVMKHFNISDSQITVSSQGLLSGKNRIHLNTLSSYDGKGGWSPKVSDENQYVEIDFYTPQYVSAIVTQGENGIDNWVTKFSVKYRNDGEQWSDIKQGDQPKIFDGNYDSDTLVTNYLGDLLRAQYIRIIPIQWHNWIAMRLDLKGCFPPSELTTALTEILGNATTIIPPKRECTKQMIFPTMEGILPGKIRVSSAESEFSGGDRIGIDTKSGPEGTGGWIAALNDENPYVLIDFQEVRNLSGVAIQGQEDEDNWVTKFEVKYSIDDVVWKDAIHETDGREFRGNNDRNTRALRWFNRIIAARYIMIIPRASHGAFAMRLEVLGCYEISEKIQTETVPPTLPTAVYCPELPDTLKENCPYCPLGYVCDGDSCIDSEDCPCYMEGKKHWPGSMFETSDCQECTCVMHGLSSCVKKECEFCAEGYTSILTSDCRCKCQKCEDGTKRYCPSDGKCIDKAKWCDGHVDCDDDEIYCATTATTPFIVTIPTTTVTIPVCDPSLNDESAVCRLNSIYLETFDGKYYQADICDHVLFRETHFQLYSVKIHKECFEDSGYCRRYLNIDIDGFNIRIGPGSERVLFGGTEVPKTKFELLSKRYKEFIIRSEGTSLRFISPKYGFEVIWGAQDNVEVKVSDCQLHQVDGLCGFYDGIKENDFQKPDGSIADTVESFTKSWSIGPSDHCIKFACDYHTKLAADHMCASIEDPIFEDCNQLLDMRRQSEICVASACECLAYNYTTPDCTCQVLESFILTCKEKAKVLIEDSWRVDFSCAPTCPPGFIWEDCGPSCELTCESFQGLSRNMACPRRCNPGCFCPSGLVRKDDRCVDATLCHDCICEGFGDPNYQTFDKISYSFQGNCTYVLVHHQSDSRRNLEVYATNTECPEEPGTTCTTGLKIIHNEIEITITRNQPVELNGKILEGVFYNFYQDGVNITATKQHVMVYIEENHFLAHYIMPNFGYIIRLPSKLYYNETAGLCGVCNFDKTDDLYHRNGYITDDIADFAYSWLVSGSREECTLTVPPVKPVDNDTCKFEKNECEMYIDPAPYIRACLNDVSYTRNLKHSVCNTVLQYASSCCEHGVILEDWIKSYGCDILCSDGMQFQCKSPCHLTCSNYKDRLSDCSIPPEYICSCPGNQVMKNGECVDPIYCEACDDEGHEVGDRWNVDLCQSCECLPNSKVICQNTVCPTIPSCPEGMSLEIVDNGTCCDQYICKQKPTECPPPLVPTCKVGAVPQLLSKEYGCPEYECVCEISLCPPLRNISLLEPGEEEFIVQNGCCLDQEIRCVLENCPPSLPCPIGSKKVETKGKCCDHAECLQEQCVYKHLFNVVEGFENETLPEENDQRLYNVGETWKDGLCLTCECYNESGQIIHFCENEKCDVPKYVESQEDYVYEEVVVPEKCCPEYVRSACQSNGTIYKVGEQWPSPYGEKCASYKCVEGANGEIEKVKTVLSCNKTCPTNARYREPTPEAEECCGYCEQFACEDDGKTYEVGQTWIPHMEKCITAECVMIGDKIEKKLTGKQCPLIPMNCPEEHKLMDESGCCELCRIIPGACEVKEIPKKASVHYFFLYDKAKGGCFNKEPLEGLTECSGNCRSENTYSSSLDLFKTECNCCIPRDYVERPITLLCEDDSTLVKMYRQPQTCECTSCFNEQQPEPQPTIPLPVIV